MGEPHTVGHVGAAHDQGNFHVLLVSRPLAPGPPVLAHSPAVVAREHYEGVGELAAVLEALYYPPYQVVDSQHRAQAVAVEVVDEVYLVGVETVLLTNPLR